MVLFRELPLDLRSRAACVCRAWRDAAADPTMWVKISVGDESGVEREVPPGLLVALCRRGGRNVEFLLALGVALKGQAGVWALAGDTDGVDGVEEIAGALLAPDTLARARELGIKATERLDDNDGHGFFGALGDAVITGPTLTNINDFRAILIQGA